MIIGCTVRVVQASSSGRLVDIVDGGVTVVFSEEELNEALQIAAGQGKVSMLFCSLSWCRPCMAMQRAFTKLAAHYHGAMFLKLDGDSNAGTKMLFKEQLKVRSTPSFFVFKDLQLVAKMTGASREALESVLRKHLPADKLAATLVYPDGALSSKS